MDFTYYINTFWFFGVTMTTVGYGDYYPSTIAGRFFSFIICIWGLFFISLGFVSLINLINMSFAERKVISVITRLRTFRSYKNKAASIITYLFQLNQARRVLLTDYTYRNRIKKMLIENRLQKELYNLKKIKHEIIELRDNTDFLQNLVHNVDNVKKLIKEIDLIQEGILIRVIKLKEKALYSN